MLKRIREFLCKEDEGIGTVEMILILVVLIAIVVIFREQITAIVEGIFTNINESVNEFYL